MLLKKKKGPKLIKAGGGVTSAAEVHLKDWWMRLESQSLSQQICKLITVSSQRTKLIKMSNMSWIKCSAIRRDRSLKKSINVRRRRA